MTASTFSALRVGLLVSAFVLATSAVLAAEKLNSGGAVSPVYRWLVTTTPNTPSAGDIDQDVINVMQASGVHGASLAIVNGTRLVYAKGYTYGPSGTPIVSPTTYFRQASVSKFVTAIAVMQLIQENKLALNEYAQSFLHASTGTKKPNDDNWDITTIEDFPNMDSCAPPLFGDDASIASALGKSLPISRTDVLTYIVRQHDSSCYPGNKALAYYNNTDYAVLGYVVAKIRGKSTMVEAIQDSLLKPLAITRTRDAMELKKDQLPGEATYYPDTPGATAPSVMSASQPMVEQGYGDANLHNFEGAGGLSAAATDIARILAAMNLNANPSNDGATIKNWPSIVQSLLNLSYQSFKDPGYTHTDSSGNSDAFGFYGLDSAGPVSGSMVPPYQGDKGGYLDTSQNAIFFQTGGIGYVICWNGHTNGGEMWYPVFQSVLKTASTYDWGIVDLFPTYGMPPLQNQWVVHLPPGFYPPFLATHDMKVMGPRHKQTTAPIKVTPPNGPRPY